MPPCEEWEPWEKLRREKEVVGIFIFPRSRPWTILTQENKRLFAMQVFLFNDFGSGIVNLENYRFAGVILR